MSYVYFMTNKSNSALYIGVTSDLPKRVWEHKNKIFSDSFTGKYNCTKLVYYEETANIEDAIKREKQLKEWQRKWKNELIETSNPKWKDLSKDWF